ncbi:MAG: cupredoxin domain-containing protein [Candidatus Brennerbacteria bacterium]|nr:cupredoxin domain-containing protein [Candidatus Brennerbacteria bacterium]
METAVRLVITVLFIALIAVGVVFLGVFGLVPAKRSQTVLEVEERTVVRETIVEREVAAPGASPVTEGGQVVTPEGAPVRQDVLPGSPEAPQQSNPVSEESLPEETVKLKISASGIAPASFNVKAGSAVVLSVTSVDDQTHVFKFKDPSLQAVAIGVGPGETRAITFNAPKGAGDYDFFCDVPGHEARGERGVMTVR